MIAPLLADINADIGPSTSYVWISLSYQLVLGIGCEYPYPYSRVCARSRASRNSLSSGTLVGRVTDIFGRRWVFTGGSFLAVIGNIVCATAPTIGTLVGGMTIVGAGRPMSASFRCDSLADHNICSNGNSTIVRFCPRRTCANETPVPSKRRTLFHLYALCSFWPGYFA